MRDTLRPVVIALLCVVAIGFAAATLSTTVDPGAGGSGEGPPKRTDTNQTDGQSLPQFAQTNVSNATATNATGRGGSLFGICYGPLEGKPTLPTAIAISLAISGIVGLLTDRWWALATILMVFPPVLLFVAVGQAGCAPPSVPEATQPDLKNVTSPNETKNTGPSRTFQTPVWIISILLMIAAAGILIGIYLRDTDEETVSAEQSTESNEQTQARIGAAAGEAADRIEGSSTSEENDVYRAWVQMTEPLDIERPETTTPAEFAAAARDAGLEPTDVQQLTQLFEEVRYGTAEPTPERETRAVETLRRIEKHYAETGRQTEDRR